MKKLAQPTRSVLTYEISWKFNSGANSIWYWETMEQLKKHILYQSFRYSCKMCTCFQNQLVTRNFIHLDVSDAFQNCLQNGHWILSAYITYKIDTQNGHLHWKVVEKTFPTGWAFQKVVDVPLEVFLFLWIKLLHSKIYLLHCYQESVGSNEDVTIVF